jgi:hypothetical protein
MLRLRRPPAPEGFEKKVSSVRKRVEEAIAKKQKPEFEPLWLEPEYKIAFQRAQHGKCGFCERALTDTGQIEHYRPKQRVDALSDDPDAWGEEIDGTNMVRGRKGNLKPLAPQGYYWLAYTWSNYVLSCERCNVAWKLTLFPIVEPHRALPPEPDAVETPLLLNPYNERTDPVRHLAYDRTGQIAPRDDSDAGWETIRSLGLDRESLRKLRHEVARKVFDLVLKLACARGGGEERTQAKRDLHALGQPDKEFAGMVRAIFEVATGHRWTDLFPEDA